MNAKQTFIVAVDFPEADSVAVRTEAVTAQLAEDHAMEWFEAEGAEAATAMTVADFEADHGTLTDGMFDSI